MPDILNLPRHRAMQRAGLRALNSLASPSQVPQRCETQGYVGACPQPQVCFLSYTARRLAPCFAGVGVHRSQSPGSRAMDGIMHEALK